MGHVDHGKTSLLDALRETDVVSGEAGGITQHIGAYQVRLKDGQRVTFLDTPGHAAFSAMRARGAQVTDIVVLVVAADDGVMPQTVEAIHHARASGAPIIVAINKIDKPDANPTRVLTDLLQHEIVTEAHGGDTLAVEVSALKKTGLDKLVETILLQAEVMDLKANPDRPAEATVIESKLDKGRGTVATVLVQKGTLKRGDIVVVGAQIGRIRAITNERGQQLQNAGPSEPVEIMGLEGVPEPGDVLNVVENENRAREVADYRARAKKQKSDRRPTRTGTSLESMMAKFKDSTAKELPILIKADVQGSAEAIVGSLDKLAHEEVRARVVLSGVGAINESDVQLAKGSGAPVIGFNVRASKEARDLAEREGVEIRYYAIIYDLIDDIKGVMSGMLAPHHARNLPRQRRGAGGVQHLQGRQGRRLPRHRWRRPQGREGPHPARQRRHPGNGCAHHAEALQGRSERSRRRPGMRHELRPIPGHQARRRHRVLQRRSGSALALRRERCGGSF